MKTEVLHKAESRGFANHGWLKSYHTFSFANYYDPDRTNFGALRVLNDDWVSAAMGFGTHPHKNMEIISIPLAGELEHKDSMGTVARIKAGDIQVMSAGTGIAHSEYNASGKDPVQFLQIWIIPNQLNVKPRYDQITLQKSDLQNRLAQIVSPNENEEGVWIHQNAWFHMGQFEEGKEQRYSLKKAENGLYAFVLEGGFWIDETEINRRDGLAITGIDAIQIRSKSKGSTILLMEVPLEF
jgi:redox-sensitive bicupin YhaK (pirin superfamily)